MVKVSSLLHIYLHGWHYLWIPSLGLAFLVGEPRLILVKGCVSLRFGA